MSIYNNTEIILATKHKKEEAIQKPFLESFEATIFVPNDYDTDQFGTFTGEIARVKTAYETVLEKARLAAMHYDFDYAIANEGSFGPHPSLFFAPGDVELMSFIDIKNDINVVEFEITTDTNYNHVDITQKENYDYFLTRIKFPSHGIIVRSLDDHSIIKKGVRDFDELNKTIASGFSKYKKLRLETDMRAMMNPTRMNIIHQLAIKLVNRLKKTCNKCHAPGFGKISFSGNLPCKSCGTKTELYKNKILSCIKCDYQEKLPRPDLLQKSDPKYCPYCNP
ncbi:MAG: hypothetical protein NTU49_02190 [Gammaproteobacteria bacterium]|nr:hypothetical protein [Gammaproteobacteria bacterium]